MLANPISRAVLALVILPFLALPNPATASITFDSATFGSFTIISDTTTGFSASAEILQGGVVAGTIIGTMVYGGGTNPFNSGAIWSDGNQFRTGGKSTQDGESNETANGFWSFSVSANAGWQVDGISLLTTGTTIANPVFANLTSNGVATVSDDQQGTVNELFASHNDGDSFVNGDDLVFNTGPTNNGIRRANHALQWSYDSVGATTLSFNYQAGPVGTIADEGIAVDVQLSVTAVPEPSSCILLCLGSLAIMRRRK